MYCATEREVPDVAGYDFQPRQGFRNYESQYAALGIGYRGYDESMEPEVAGFSKRFKKLRKNVSRSFKKYIRPLAPIAGTLLGGPVGGMLGGIVAGQKKPGAMEAATPGIMPEPMIMHMGGASAAFSGGEYGPPPPGESNGSLGPRGESPSETGGSKFMPLAILAAAVGVIFLIKRR